MHISKRTQTVPTNWKIWIGNYRRRNWIGQWVHAAVPISGPEHIPEEGDAGLPLPNTQSTSFVVGKLFVNVLSSRIRAVVRRQEIGASMPRIWPFRQSPIRWPPRHVLTDAEVDGISRALADRASGGRALS